MPTIRPHLLLIATLLSATAVAQQADSSANPATWREGVIARCQQQFSIEQCQNEQFLEDNFHVTTLEVAHRTAARRAQQERSALRELTLQHFCHQSPNNSCAGAGNPTQCATDIAAACTALQTQSINCQQNVQSLCANATDAGTCTDQRSVRCPSIKQQSLDEILAKYPNLTLEQKSRLAAESQQLDAQGGSWFSNLLSWIGLSP